MYLSFALVAAAVSVVMLRRTGGDTLEIASPGTVHAGSTFDLPIRLKTSSTDISSLEWQISAPANVAFEATSSLNGKSMQCYKEHCMLYGGQSNLSSGIVATFKVHLSATPASANVSIGLHHVLGATRDAEPVKIGDATLKLNIQP